MTKKKITLNEIKKYLELKGLTISKKNKNKKSYFKENGLSAI